MQRYRHIYFDCYYNVRRDTVIVFHGNAQWVNSSRNDRPLDQAFSEQIASMADTYMTTFTYMTTS